jgi:TonB family protein
VSLRNVGTRAVCAVLAGSLSAEFGLVAQTSALPPYNVPAITELLPREEAHRDFIFFPKRSVDPLDFAVNVVSYGRECGDSLPRSAETSVHFAIREISSPQPVQSPRPKPEGVSQPMLIFKVDPEYSEEALKAKWQGTVVLALVVDEKGRPQQIRVVKALGLGLDQKAIEAVEKWRFEPAKNDKSTAVYATIEVNFHLPPDK